MNNARRNEIKKAIKEIEYVVSRILSDEEDSFDNMPEGLQDSYNGEKSQEAQEALSNAVDYLNEAIDALNEATM